MEVLVLFLGVISCINHAAAGARLSRHRVHSLVEKTRLKQQTCRNIMNTKNYVLEQISTKSLSYKVCAPEWDKKEKDMIDELKNIAKSKLQSYLKSRHKCLNTEDSSSIAHRLSKRSITFNQEEAEEKVANAFAYLGYGVIAELQSCQGQGHTHSNTATLQMCQECTYLITLPAQYSPRYHLHKTCDADGDNTGAIHCLTGYGACVSTVSHVTVTNGNNQDEQVEFTKGCACQVLDDSLFSVFV